jgi:ferredoxin-NADP reductase
VTSGEPGTALGPSAAAGPTSWQRAVIAGLDHPNPNGVRLRLDVPDRQPQLPGQYYVLRLTAEDGYVAQRSYSVASAPSDPLVELWVERITDGEVSGFLAEVAEPGDELEVRGPIGGWFAWDGSSPAVGVGGGSGVVPLVAMLRHAVHLQRPELFRLAVSARTWAELPYADELSRYGAFIALSREASPTGRTAARLSEAELAGLAGLAPAAGTFFVCGSAGFSDAAGQLLQRAGVPAPAIRVESFGPTG